MGNLDIDLNALEAKVFTSCLSQELERFKKNWAGLLDEYGTDAHEAYSETYGLREPDTMVVYVFRSKVMGASLKVSMQETYAMLGDKPIVCHNGHQRSLFYDLVKDYRAIVYCRALSLADAVDGRPRWRVRR